MRSPFGRLSFFFLLFLLHFSTSISSAAEVPSLPLSTNSRWIVDNDGRRVKLACVSWAAHLEPVVAEGLSKQPLDTISKLVASMGFNCVRLTFATQLFTNATLGSLTVRQSLTQLGLNESVAGIDANNPELVDLTVVQAYQAVVSNLAKNNIMLILDNHLSKPMWCCSKKDGNGFFGDEFFNPDEWLNGLETVAKMFMNTSNVVGMSLRNELRGPGENVDDWYRYMEKGAEVVHSANPGLLVILSGLNFDQDLTFLSQRQVQLSFQGKVVFEKHHYAFTDSSDWEGGDLNKVCGSFISKFMKSAGFLLDQGWPLLLSEFGGDQNGANIADNRFMTCILSMVARLDLDWILWALQGSYYIREGQAGTEETYGAVTADWSKARNPQFSARVAALRSPLQGPGLQIKEPYSVLFHPLTGQCAVVKPETSQLVLGSCAESPEWIYTQERNLMIRAGSSQWLGAEGVGQAARVGMNCTGSSTTWELTSETGMHIASSLPHNGSTLLCLEASADGSILTNDCKCINENGSCTPESQWFKIVDRKES